MQILLLSSALACLAATFGGVLVAHGEPATSLSPEVETATLRTSDILIDRSGSPASTGEEDANGPALAFSTTGPAGDGFRMTRGIDGQTPRGISANTDLAPSLIEEPRAAMVPIPTPRPVRPAAYDAKPRSVAAKERLQRPAAGKQERRWTRPARPTDRALRTAESLPRLDRRERLRRYWVTGGFR